MLRGAVKVATTVETWKIHSIASGAFPGNAEVLQKRKSHYSNITLKVPGKILQVEFSKECEG